MQLCPVMAETSSSHRHQASAKLQARSTLRHCTCRHHEEYLDICRCLRAVYETPSVTADKESRAGHPQADLLVRSHACRAPSRLVPVAPSSWLSEQLMLACTPLLVTLSHSQNICTQTLKPGTLVMAGIKHTQGAITYNGNRI